MFTTHGLPVTFTSDNGPQFMSEELRSFMNTNNIPTHSSAAPTESEHVENKTDALPADSVR